MISVTSSAGNPTVSNTITIVTRPACGMPAAPMLAAVAVILKVYQTIKVIKILSLSFKVQFI